MCMMGGGAMSRRSWQPMHDVTVPGMKFTKLCIFFTALPSASSAVKDSALFAGTLKCAEPSSSTFTVPSGRSRLNVPSIVIGSIAPVRWHASGRTSLTSSFFMSELFTEPIFLPIATSIKATVASSAP